MAKNSGPSCATRPRLSVRRTPFRLSASGRDGLAGSSRAIAGEASGVATGAAGSAAGLGGHGRGRAATTAAAVCGRRREGRRGGLRKVGQAGIGRRYRRVSGIAKVRLAVAEAVVMPTGDSRIAITPTGEQSRPPNVGTNRKTRAATSGRSAL